MDRLREEFEWWWRASKERRKDDTMEIAQHFHALGRREALEAAERAIETVETDNLAEGRIKILCLSRVMDLSIARAALHPEK